MRRFVSRIRAWRSRDVAFGLAAILGACVLLGFFGDLAPLFDTMGSLRAHLAALLALVSPVLFVLRRPVGAAAGLLVAGLGLYTTLPFMLPARPGPGADAPRYTLLQMNLRSAATNRDRALSLVARLRPDVVAAQELTPEWREAFARLESAYPFQFYCSEPFLGGADTAIVSRRPFVENSTVCNDAAAFSARRIDFNGLPVTVGSQHLRWPWPGRQGEMLEAALPDLAKLADPVLVAGDFNAAPWSASIRRYAQASGTRVLAGIGPTWMASALPAFLARYAGLPIDNVLVSDGIEILGVERLEPTASDHLPVLVTFSLRFALPEEPDVQSAGRR